MSTTSNQADPQLAKCVGCTALPGEDHDDGCDHARCPECGEQFFGCFEHEDSDRPALWHGIDQRAEVAQARNWWTTVVGIDHLVEDYTRVLYAIGRDEIEWDPETQRYAEPAPKERSIMTTTSRERWYPEMPPALPGETDDQYTNRLTGADGTDRRPYDHRRNRQCSIGWHEECSDPAGNTCECPCHRDPALGGTEPA